jgi:hypothetical protein
MLAANIQAVPESLSGGNSTVQRTAQYRASLPVMICQPG